MAAVYPRFHKLPVDRTVKSGQNARFDCAAFGQPEPEISWQKDGGRDFPAARERRMNVRDDEYVIAAVKRQDEGVYTCTATNDAGTIMTNVTLRVLGECLIYVVQDPVARFHVTLPCLVQCQQHVSSHRESYTNNNWLRCCCRVAAVR